MALNRMEQLIVSVIVNHFNDLMKEDELFEFVDTREGFTKKEEKVQCVSLTRLYSMYPDYVLTRKLIEFSQLVIGYLGEYNTPVGGRGHFGMGGPSTYNLKMSLLEQNGVEFAYILERTIQHANFPSGPEELNREQATAFAIKIKDIYVDFNLFFAPQKVKGVGEEVYVSSVIQTTQKQQRHESDPRPQKPSEFDRQVIHSITQWATNQALNFVEKARHLRRLNKPMQNVVIQLDMTSYIVPEPEKTEKEDITMTMV